MYKGDKIGTRNLVNLYDDVLIASSTGQKNEYLLMTDLCT